MKRTAAPYLALSLTFGISSAFAQSTPVANVPPPNPTVAGAPATEHWEVINPDLSIAIDSLQRTKHNTAKLKFRMKNTGTAPLEYRSLPGYYGVGGAQRFGGLRLRDLIGRTEYEVLYSSTSNYLTSIPADIAPGAVLNGWAEFPPLPKTVTAISVVFNNDASVDDVTVSDIK